MSDPREPLAQLADMLADLYFRNSDIQRVVTAAGMRPGFIEWSDRPVNTWSSLIREASFREHQLERLIDVVLRDYPEHPGLLAARNGMLRAISAAPPFDWHDVDGDTHEKIIGSNDLVPVWFLDRARELARAVGLVRLADGTAGSGFLVSRDLVLTNNHVAPSAAAMHGASLILNFETTAAGTDAPVHTVAFAADRGFVTDITHDWSLVRLGVAPGEEWGVIPVEPCDVVVGAAVYIIQHPGGATKHIALGDNRVTFVGDGRVQYLTDTLPGSSGSPVFDRALRLVALHHSGGYLREPGSKTRLFRNEGIAISEVHAGLVASQVWP